MSASSLPENANVQDLSSAELEQINGGLISAINLGFTPVPKIPPLGACAPCRSGLDRFVINDPRVLPMLNLKLAAPTLGF